jgi:hypothetical protein
MVSCSSLTDCYNCTTVTWGCHWCPDQTCSLYGSPHCLVGETCAAPPDCIRTEPEFNGYQAPPAKAVLLFLLIALIIMAAFICCLWGCFAVWDRRRMKALKNRIESRRRSQSASNSAATPSSRGVQLSSLPVSASFRGSLNSHSSSSSQPRVSVVTTKKKVTPGNELGENLLERKEQQDSSDDSELVGENAPRYNVRINPDGTTEVIQAAPASGVASPTIPFPPPLPPLPRKQQLLRTGAKFCTIMGCLGTFIALIVVCLMFPHMPQYSVCNKDIQWGSVSGRHPADGTSRS